MYGQRIYVSFTVISSVTNIRTTKCGPHLSEMLPYLTPFQTVYITPLQCLCELSYQLFKAFPATPPKKVLYILHNLVGGTKPHAEQQSSFVLRETINCTTEKIGHVTYSTTYDRMSLDVHQFSLSLHKSKK